MTIHSTFCGVYWGQCRLAVPVLWDDWGQFFGFCGYNVVVSITVIQGL